MNETMEYLLTRNKTISLLISILETYGDDTVDLSEIINGLATTLPKPYLEHLQRLEKELSERVEINYDVPKYADLDFALKVHGLNIVLFSLSGVTPLTVDLYYERFISKCRKRATDIQMNELLQLKSQLIEVLESGKSIEFSEGTFLIGCNRQTFLTVYINGEYLKENVLDIFIRENMIVDNDLAVRTFYATIGA